MQFAYSDDYLISVGTRSTWSTHSITGRWAPSQEFLIHEGSVEPKNLHFWHVPCCHCDCCSRDHTLRIIVVNHGVRPEEGETPSALGQFRKASYKKQHLEWVWKVTEGKIEHMHTYRWKASSGAVSSSENMDSWGDSAELVFAGEAAGR